MSTLSLLLLLVTAAALGLFVLELFAKSPMFAAYLVLGLSALLTLLSPELVPPLSVGTVTVYAPDILFALIAGAAFIRVLGLRRPNLGHRALMVVAVLAVIAASRGVPQNLQGALNEFRSAFYFLAGAAYFATATRAEWHLGALTNAFLITAALILTTALLLWGPAPSFAAAPSEPGYRVIGANGALVLAQAILLTVPAWFRPNKKPMLQWLSVAFLLAVIVLQHRTVWIALTVGLLVVAWRDLRVRRSVVVVLGLVTFTVVSLQMVAPSTFNSSSLAESLSGSSNLDTFDWRVEGWGSLISTEGPSTRGDVLIGTPYGTGFDRIVGGIRTDVQPHNYYLNQYLRHGILGLAAFLMMYLYVVSALRRQPPTGGIGFSDPGIVLALIVTQLVFFIANNPGIEQGLITGLGLSLALRVPRRGPGQRARPEPRSTSRA
jgi:hypothetical protein